MGIALQKTFTFLLLIGIGVLLKKKIRSRDELKGIKALILNIALPATIFIALLKIEIKPSLILLPILALVANLLLWLGAKVFIKIAGIDSDTPISRTLQLLIPSFAPGLSCFPFITEFLGDSTLAMAAFADVGNKIFVLIILYIISMRWYYQLIAQQNIEIKQTQSRLKDLGMALLREPINMVLLIAILMLIFGLNIQSLPSFIQDSISRMSLLMTPMILLFIGIAVKLKKEDIALLLQVLFWRSGFAFLSSAILLFLLPANTPIAVQLLAVIFPQSASSFWPFAHMTAVENLEADYPSIQTFDLELALNLLAFSLPFSTVIVLSVCTTGTLFTNPLLVLGLGIAFIVIATLPLFLKKISSKSKETRLQKIEIGKVALKNEH